MDSQKTQTGENKESLLWYPCETFAPMQFQHHKTKSCILLQSTKQSSSHVNGVLQGLQNSFSCRKDGDSCVLRTSVRHCTSMEHADSQFFCWTKATAHCLLSGYEWIDIVETTTKTQKPGFHLYFSLIFLPFSFFFWWQDKRKTQDSSETLILIVDFQCWMHTAKTEVTTMKVRLLIIVSYCYWPPNRQIRYPLPSTKLNRRMGRKHVQAQS